jgi:hypothetical protein
MPKVEQYQPNQVLTEVAKGPRAQGLPAAAFNNGAEGVAAIGAATFEIADSISTTEAEDAFNRFKKDTNDFFFAPETGYLNTAGRVAFDGAGDASTTLEDMQKNYSENLSQSARDKFDKVASAHTTRGQSDIMRHASAGQKSWEIATIEAQVEGSIETAAYSWNDPKRVAIERINGESALTDSLELRGLNSGDAKNEALQTYWSSLYSSVIGSATSQTAKDGQEMLDKYDKWLEEPDRQKLKKAIETQEKKEDSDNKSAYTVATAQGLIAKYDNVSDAMKDPKMKALYKSDPDLYQSTRSELSSQFTIQKYAKVQREDEANDIAVNRVQDLKNPITPYQFATGAVNPEDKQTFDAMSTTDKSRLLTGVHTVTNQVDYSRLINMDDATFAQEDLRNYGLSQKDYNALTNQQQNIRQAGVTKDTKAQEKADAFKLPKTATDAVLKGFYGKTSTWIGTKGIKVEGARRGMEVEIAREIAIKGRELTQTELGEVLESFSSKMFLDRDWIDGVHSQDINITTEDPATVRGLSKYNEDDIQWMYEQLRDKKVKDTSAANILRYLDQEYAKQQGGK